MSSSNHDRDITSQLKQEYLRSFPEKVKTLKIVRQELLAVGDVDGSLKLIQNTAYKIAGSSGAYGFEQISSIAGDIEYLCSQYQREHRQNIHQESIDLIQKYLDKLIVIFQRHIRAI